MPKKNLYIREEDEYIWQTVERLSGKSLSKIVSEVLRKKVEEMEAIKNLPEGMERLLITYYDREDNYFHRKAFNGRWIIKDKQIHSKKRENDENEFLSIALTEKEQFLLLFKRSDDIGNYDIVKDYKSLLDFSSLEYWDLAFELDEDTIAKISYEIGEDYVEFLDI